MKKTHFYLLVLGVLGGLLFSIGLCMCLIPQWEAFDAGVVLTAVGAIALLVLVLLLRRGKPARKCNWKVVGKVAYGVIATLVLGVGMTLVLVYELFLPGIALGIVGVLLLLGLIPLCLGLK